MRIARPKLEAGDASLPPCPDPLCVSYQHAILGVIAFVLAGAIFSDPGRVDTQLRLSRP